MEVRRFTRVVLALGYMHESVQRWLAGEKWDFEIRCSLEETPLGTGGAVRQALSRTDGDEVYILNGDTFFDVDTDEMARVHRASGAAATIALKPMTDFSRYGVVETASQREDRRVPRKKILPARTDQRRRLPGRQKIGTAGLPVRTVLVRNGYFAATGAGLSAHRICERRLFHRHRHS